MFQAIKHKWQSDGTEALRSTFKTASGLCQWTQCHTLQMLIICIKCISRKLSWSPRQICFSLSKTTIQIAYDHSNNATSCVSDLMDPIHRTQLQIQNMVVSSSCRSLSAKLQIQFHIIVILLLGKRKKKIVNHLKMVIS